jgi:hypothetical protein
LFVLLIIVGGLLYFQLAEQSGEPVDSRIEAMYLVLTMVFM